MLRVSICDDNREFLEVVCSFFDDKPQYRVRRFEQASAFLNEGGAESEIAILDIHIADSSGIDLAMQIAGRNPACRVIFLSDYLSYATQVYDVPHVYFVLKSEMEERLPTALEKCAAEIEQSRENALPIRTSDSSAILRMDKIRYMERNLRITRIYCEDTTYITKESVTALIAKLDSRFCHCHSSYIVNLGWVRSVASGELILTTGEHIPVSRSHSRETQQAFAEYWGGV